MAGITTSSLQLTQGAEYRIKNAWSNKYAAPAAQTAGQQVQHFTLNNSDNKQIWIAELADTYTDGSGAVIRSYNLKNKGTSLYWTNPASTAYGSPCTVETLITNNTAGRQWYKFTASGSGSYFMRPNLPADGFIQLAGPVAADGQYIQVFPNAVSASNELWLIEPVSNAGTQLAKPVIKAPVYSDHGTVVVENVEAGAGVQLYINGVAFGAQRTNSGSVTASVEVQVPTLEKAKSLTADVFKTGRSGNTSDAVIVQELAGIVQKTATNGAVTFNLEILKVLAGTNVSNLSAERFDPPRIILADIASISSARSARDNANYKRNTL